MFLDMQQKTTEMNITTWFVSILFKEKVELQCHIFLLLSTRISAVIDEAACVHARTCGISSNSDEQRRNPQPAKNKKKNNAKNAIIINEYNALKHNILLFFWLWILIQMTVMLTKKKKTSFFHTIFFLRFMTAENSFSRMNYMPFHILFTNTHSIFIKMLAAIKSTFSGLRWWIVVGIHKRENNNDFCSIWSD